jgi:hypothetical protein
MTLVGTIWHRRSGGLGSSWVTGPAHVVFQVDRDVDERVGQDVVHLANSHGYRMRYSHDELVAFFIRVPELDDTIEAELRNAAGEAAELERRAATIREAIAFFSSHAPKGSDEAAQQAANESPAMPAAESPAGIAAETRPELDHEGNHKEDAAAGGREAAASESQPLSRQLCELGFCGSRAEARRLIQQGVVLVNGGTITDPHAEVLVDVDVVSVGKRQTRGRRHA